MCSISTGKSNTQDRVDDGIYPFYVRSPIVERSNRYLFDEEAVLTVGDGVGTGKVFHYVNGKYDLHQRVYRMFDFSEEITAKYFYYYFSNHFYDRVMSMTAKTSVDSVRYEMIADMDISLPKIQEQSTISDYFDNLDNLITLHQRKYNICKKNKVNAWEQRKLGDITESYSGGTPTAGKKEYYDGNIPFIRSGEISSDKTELFISEEGLNKSSAKMVKIGDILYALYGATSGEVSISKLKGAINQAILAIQPHQNYDSQFLMQWLRKSKENIIGTYLQGGQGNLSGNIVKELIIDIPTYEEQKEIGAYLKKLDHLITLHQCKQIARIKNVNNDEKQRKPIKKLIIFENSLFLVDDIRLLHRMILYITMNYILLRLNTVIIKGDDEYVRIRS